MTRRVIKYSAALRKQTLWGKRNTTTSQEPQKHGSAHERRHILSLRILSEVLPTLSLSLSLERKTVRSKALFGTKRRRRSLSLLLLLSFSLSSSLLKGDFSNDISEERKKREKEEEDGERERGASGYCALWSRA